MYTIVIALIILVSLILILFVLIQNSKGGGLASNFSTGGQTMGVRKTTDFLEKVTWGSAIVIFVLSFVAVMVLPKNKMVGSTLIDDQVESMLPAQNEIPGFQLPTETDFDASEEVTE